jgi:hypothetical protein
MLPREYKCCHEGWRGREGVGENGERKLPLRRHRTFSGTQGYSEWLGGLRGFRMTTLSRLQNQKMLKLGSMRLGSSRVDQAGSSPDRKRNAASFTTWACIWNINPHGTALGAPWSESSESSKSLLESVSAAGAYSTSRAKSKYDVGKTTA